METQSPNRSLCNWNGPVYSPFSGQPTYDEAVDAVDPANNPTFLFCFHGDVGLFAHQSARLLELDPSLEQDGPLEAAENVVLGEGGFVLEVDCGWSGIVIYGFAPGSEDRC